MANLSLNQNQFAQTAAIGMVTADPQPQTFSCQIDPASSWTGPVTAGQSVKLVDSAGAMILVEPCDADTDSVFGVIALNLRKASVSLGDYVEVVGRGGVLMLKSSAAISRGDYVAITNQTVSTNDPTVAALTTAGKTVAGVALQPASASGQLIKVLVQPGLNTGAGAAGVAGVINS